MKKHLFTLIALILCLGSAFGQQNWMKITYFGHLYLHSKINGHPASLVFDTGSPYTCMDSTFFADSGIEYKHIWKAQLGGAGNNQETVRVIVDELTYTVDEKEHLSHISPIIQLKPIVGDYADGILGIDEMGGKVIAIHYLDEQMGVWDQPGDTTGFTSIPIRYDKIRIFVPLAVTVRDGKTIQGEALVDLGSGNSVTLTSEVAKQYSLKELSPLLHYTSSIGGIGGESSSCDFRATNIALGPFSLDNVTMDFSNNTGGALSNAEYFAIIGNDIWERFDMMIDLSSERLYLKPNAKFDEPFKSPVRGFSYTDRSRTLGYWVVNGLYAQSNAEKAGLREGDHITAINGRSVKEISFEEQRTIFDGLSGVTLTIQRGDTLQEIRFDFDEPKI
jgi:hypothetical protein